jgi:hypothetical protein
MNANRGIQVRPYANGYRFSLQLAGTVCEVDTNDSRLEFTLRHWTSATPETNVSGSFKMQILVSRCSTPPSGQPHFRGLNHVVIASFGHPNVFVFDLLRRRIAARVSERVACDTQFWNERLIPIAVGVFGSTLGVVPVHCACLCLEGEGVLVAGISGAGKSTLTAALVQAGFDYVSDDWTYIARGGAGLLAHGLSAPIKLLPNAIAHFPLLAGHALVTALNGELAYEVGADTFGGAIVRSCVPLYCIFLERDARFTSSFAPMSVEDVRSGFRSSVERLPSLLADAARTRSKIIEQLAGLPCWTFRYAGTPQFAAQEILSFVFSQSQVLPA